MRRALVSLSCCAVAAALVAPPQRSKRTRLQAESKYWSYDGVDVHYAIERAPGANAVVVFGPGFGAGAFQFEDVCRHVADGGVDAIAMDWVGQGKSWPEGDMAGRNFGVETWIAQLTAFVEQLDYSQVYVAGNSIGGLVAASVAARSDRVAGCALLNPTPFWSFWGVNGCPLWGGDLPGPARSLLQSGGNRANSSESKRTRFVRRWHGRGESCRTEPTSKYIQATSLAHRKGTQLNGNLTSLFAIPRILDTI